jgi:acetyl-CoA carboxylase biotin carboxyl carrier protein
MKQLTASMAGIIVQILVKPGDVVTDGMEVAIFESMKMQIPVTSNVSGKVSKIHFAIGDFINEGDVILSLE